MWMEFRARSAKGELARAAGLPADTPLQVAPPTTELPDTINVQDMRRLLDEGRIRYLYPDEPNHPRQKYKAGKESK